MTPAPAAVEAIGLSKTYPGEIEAVKDLSFEVARGEAFGLLGPNGAGKSTTIGMLTTTVVPTSGRAVLSGFDVARQPRRARAVSSVVFQDSVVDRPLSGRQNLELHLRLWGVNPGPGHARMRELAGVVGIDDILDRPVETYSGGQRRRMEIARALLSQPDVLFLDEPTVGLDTRIRHDLFDVIATLRERTGVTVILTTHYLDEAEQLCDRIAVIDAGVMVACDSPQNLLATMGQEIVEIRTDEAGGLVRSLRSAGIESSEIRTIGNTVTVLTTSKSSREVTEALAAQNRIVRSSTVRRPTLDDVYLRLTGGRIETQAD
jgi:ABC-2 type transport system ATP-binding protein